MKISVGFASLIPERINYKQTSDLFINAGENREEQPE